MENTPDILEFSGKYRFLSNFYPAETRVLGIDFPSSEHAYQACKTKDIDMRYELAEMTAGQAKRAGGKLVLRPDWDNVTKVECMELCLRAKFMNPELAKKLIHTESAQLVEGNTWGDTYWGIFRNMGKNMLGKLLMEVRGDLQKWQRS